MRLPTQSVPAYRSSVSSSAVALAEGGGVAPQASVCTPCVQVGGGQWCINLPIFGRKCFNVPSFGRWKACCRTRWGIPPVSCGISRC
jgi:hypothetical protein